jgi:hypothetical protein
VVCKTTNKAITHLLKRHDMNNNNLQEDEGRPELSCKRRHQSVANQLSSSKVRQVVSNVDVVCFRYFLIRWIVVMHLAVSIVEHQAFRDLVLCIAPALEVFIVSAASTIRRWI